MKIKGAEMINISKLTWFTVDHLDVINTNVSLIRTSDSTNNTEVEVFSDAKGYLCLLPSENGDFVSLLRFGNTRTGNFKL